MILGIAPLLLLLQMEGVTQSGDACTKYAVPRALAGPSGERIMERRPNSEADTPCPPLPIHRALPCELPPASLERDRARTYRMMTVGTGRGTPRLTAMIPDYVPSRGGAGPTLNVVRPLSLEWVILYW